MKGALLSEEQEGLETILERAREGSREAFDQLIRRFEKKVMKTALYLTRNLADAQDVAQEVYIKIFRHLNSCEDEGKIDRWVYRITVNAARDFLRRSRFRLPLRVLLPSFSPRDPVTREEFRSRLMESLAKLSFRERAAFILRELQDLETSEVAEILGCGEVSVRGYLHSARAKLQKSFRDKRYHP